MLYLLIIFVATIETMNTVQAACGLDGANVRIIKKKSFGDTNNTFSVAGVVM